MAQIIWLAVRTRRLGGFKFREQHTIADHHVADFACIEAKLLVKLDAGQHGTIIDVPATAVWNPEDIACCDSEATRSSIIGRIIETILAAILGRTAKVAEEDPHPTLSREGGRG